MTKNIETLHKQTTEITDPELTKNTSTVHDFRATELTQGDHKPCTPSVHIKIAGIYGCSSH